MLVFMSRQQAGGSPFLGHLCHPSSQALLCGLSDELIYDLHPKLNELKLVDERATSKQEQIITRMECPSSLSSG